MQFLVFVFRLEVSPERPLPNAAPMADIRRERSVREPQETQFVGLTGAILRAVEICGAVLVRAWDAILRLGTKFPSAMWAGTDAILRFGFEFEVGFIALFALVISFAYDELGGPDPGRFSLASNIAMDIVVVTAGWWWAVIFRRIF